MGEIDQKNDEFDGLFKEEGKVENENGNASSDAENTKPENPEEDTMKTLNSKGKEQSSGRQNSDSSTDSKKTDAMAQAIANMTAVVGDLEDEMGKYSGPVGGVINGVKAGETMSSAEVLLNSAKTGATNLGELLVQSLSGFARLKALVEQQFETLRAQHGVVGKSKSALEEALRTMGLMKDQIEALGRDKEKLEKQNRDAEARTTQAVIIAIEKTKTASAAHVKGILDVLKSGGINVEAMLADKGLKFDFNSLDVDLGAVMAESLKRTALDKKDE